MAAWRDRRETRRRIRRELKWEHVLDEWFQLEPGIRLEIIAWGSRLDDAQTIAKAVCAWIDLHRKTHGLIVTAGDEADRAQEPKEHDVFALDPR